MPYTTIPTLASGDVLSAVHLNIIKSNIEYLYAQVQRQNMPFSSQTLSGDGTTDNWYMRYVHRYLHFKFHTTTGDTDEIGIWVNGNREYYDASNHTSPYSFSGYIDMTTITTVPTVGDFYPIYVVFSNGTSGDLIIDYFIQSPNTSL